MTDKMGPNKIKKKENFLAPRNVSLDINVWIIHMLLLKKLPYWFLNNRDLRHEIFKETIGRERDSVVD